jgi:caffeoyl-CoA O-methyltransferase
MSNDLDLEQYILNHTTKETDVLTKLNRETNIKILNPRMLSGQVQGWFLTMICQMICPRLVLEIGTYTGYSAICMTQGMSDDAVLHTIEINDELESFAKKYFLDAGQSRKIVYHSGNAIDIIPNLNLAFDLIYIDGEKREYPEYYKVAIKCLKPGGFMIADNVLWDGKVLDTLNFNDPATKAIHRFNELVQKDDSVENVLLPMRDGLMLIRKKA